LARKLGESRNRYSNNAMRRRAVAGVTGDTALGAGNCLARERDPESGPSTTLSANRAFPALKPDLIE
jgi:hypothetical protein